MKKIFVFIFAVLLSLNALAQLEVKPGSFKEVPGFVNINTDKMDDDNNVLYAVVKINTVNINDKQRHQLLFQGNAATFIEVEYHVGEVWVYLSSTPATYLKISHPDFGSTEFWFPFDLQPKKGYEMTLVNKTAPAVAGSGSLTVNTKPENGAIIALNGKVLNQKTPYSNDMIAAGQYEISVSKERYKTVTETITIADGDNKNITITLPIDVATITVTADAQTDVYIDGNLMKRGTWSGELYSGSHDIVCKKQYYYDAKQTIIVEAGTPASYSLNINPIYGKINIASEPTGATVYIDGNEYGVTPLAINGIIIGPHELKIEKERWRTLKKQIVLEEGKILTLNEALENCPDGAINALFSVSPTEKVYFSKGNLQYQASTKTWRFAEHQWDIIGSENSKISENYDGWIDLFGWGTSGYNGKNPWMTSTTRTDYGNGGRNIAGSNYDWGVYNTISNGGSVSWRTLTQDEWVYVFYDRSTSSGIRYARAAVNGINGVILLPDNWNKTNYKLSKTNKSDAKYSSNIISQTEWINIFGANGAIFLPAAGCRVGTHVIDIGSHCVYWSASYSDSDSARIVFLYYGRHSVYPWYDRDNGRSVRLVCPAE